jgi:hypothetical protein
MKGNTRMQRKAVTVHLLATSAGNHHWELRKATDGEHGAFGTEKAALDDALAMAAVYLTHGASVTTV